jgi:nitrate reductase beta subunit
VGRIRYVGIFLYNADRIVETASVAADTDVYPAHLDILLDPNDKEVQKAAVSAGIAPNVLRAATRSPVYALAKQWRLALPLHPEFRTLPMVWYIPPLSPIHTHAEPGQTGDSASALIDRLRIPVTYLANLLTAGDEAPVRLSLKRLAALRDYMRSLRVEGKADTSQLDVVGLSRADADQIYRLLALAPLQERFMLPTAVREQVDIHADQGCCGFAQGSGCS